jgi:hypothetical protein
MEMLVFIRHLQHLNFILLPFDFMTDIAPVTIFSIFFLKKTYFISCILTRNQQHANRENCQVSKLIIRSFHACLNNTNQPHLSMKSQHPWQGNLKTKTVQKCLLPKHVFSIIPNHILFSCFAT